MSLATLHGRVSVNRVHHGPVALTGVSCCLTIRNYTNQLFDANAFDTTHCLNASRAGKDGVRLVRSARQ